MEKKEWDNLIEDVIDLKHIENNDIEKKKFFRNSYNNSKFLVLLKTLADDKLKINKKPVRSLSVRRIAELLNIEQNNIYTRILPKFEGFGWCQRIKTKSKAYIAPNNDHEYDKYYDDVKIGLRRSNPKVLNKSSDRNTKSPPTKGN